VATIFKIVWAVGLTLVMGKPASAGADFGIAKRAVLRSLQDPASARFSGFKKVSGGVCGEVHVNNSYEGRPGPRLFVYVSATKRAYVVRQGGDASSSSLEALDQYEKICRR